MPVLEIGDLPPELTSNPTAYVAVAGLEIENNTIHKTIWDSFIASRQDRAPLFLKLLPIGKEFPKAKPKVRKMLAILLTVCYISLTIHIMLKY